jgi:Methylene-tetrahydrofolate reductase C terminal
MIGQRKKPVSEVLHYLEGKRIIALIGCGGCASTFQTGDEKAIEFWVSELEKAGKSISVCINLPLGVFTCYLPMSSRYLDRHLDTLASSDAVLNLSCGDGLQVVQTYLDERNIVKPVIPAVNSLGVMGDGPTRFVEKCRGCGDCKLALTAGICPFTQCPKGLLNGPCGGLGSDGACEIDPERTCAWIQIYERLEKMGKLDNLKDIAEPQDWSKSDRARTIDDESLKPAVKPRILKRK